MNKASSLSRITIGMLEEEVQAIIGKPDAVGGDENGIHWHYHRESLIVCFRRRGRREVYKVLKKRTEAVNGHE